MKRILIICFLFFFSVITEAQTPSWSVTEMQTMPMRISNNAISEGIVSGVPFVYSFAGIDSTKLSSGITLKSFRYDTQNDLWDQIPDLPDTLGKIASAASSVKNKIYIIGGYHVLPNGNELSSDKVHIFDPQSNSFLPDAANVPLAIDDQAQAVWRDSLIYVISGWSNSTNVANVQIFNPVSNSWSVGTPVPNTASYKVFGSAGIIVGDTIFYYGGASLGSSFPASSSLRMGIINPLNPLQISWTNPTNFLPAYRCAAMTDSLNNVYFLGGSSTTYNFDGIAYNGSGGVDPSNLVCQLNTSNPAVMISQSMTLPMDLRGIASVSPSVKFIAGGMEAGQIVSNKMLRVSLNAQVGINTISESDQFLKIYPNPIIDNAFVEHNLHNILFIQLISSTGEIVEVFQNLKHTLSLDMTKHKPGVYYLRAVCQDRVLIKRMVSI